MYEENNVTYKIGFNWKDILIKVVLLILFILLLVWLFPNLDPFYNSVYTNNINAMKEAAEKYYTTDRLPSTVGESSSMTLKEMFDEHMLVKFTDKDGKTCDDSSSNVKVTKTSDSEYVLRVELNCGKDKDYILQTMGPSFSCSGSSCSAGEIASNTTGNNANSNSSNSNSNNDAVNNNSKNNVDADYDYYDDVEDYSQYTDVKSADMGIRKRIVTYYQHKKAVYNTKTVYTCPSGYTQQGTKCYKQTTGATIDATPVYAADQTVTTDAKYTEVGEREYVDAVKTKVGTDYACPDGYVLNGSYCVKYTDATANNGASTYTCPDGYTLSGNSCVKTYTATYKEGATSYTCPNGGSLSGKNCTITTAATANTTYTCPSGYSKNGTSCYKVYSATANTSYSCPAGYTLSGSKCTISSTDTKNATANTKYTCPSGYTLSGKKCSKKTSSSYNATASTQYGSWVASGTQYYTSASKAYTGTTSKLVYAGAVSGATCGSPCGNKGIWYKYTYYTRSASTKYSCPNGGTLSGSKCTKSTTDTKNATAKTTYSCPSGYTLSGSKCTKVVTNTINATASTKYSCPSGGTLNGTQCTLTANATANTSYSCPSGYTLSGKNCVKTYSATENKGTGAYTCPNGGTLSGSKCTVTTNATENKGNVTYSCPAGYTLEGTKCVTKVNATGTDKYAYTCPAGYTAEGTGADTKCYKVSTKNKYYCEDTNAKLEGTKCVSLKKGEITGYTCPTGYTLNGTKCTKKSTEVIDATISKQTTTSYKYTWSKSSYLEGWTFTGNTKTVTENYTAGQR